MHRAAALLLALSACGGSGTQGPVPANEFCAALVQAACDREVPCGMFPDRPSCTAYLTDAFDGCPPDVNAIALGETDYDAAAAGRLLSAIRAGACGSDLPDIVTEIPVFTPKLGDGAVCHSDVSCMVGLACRDLTIANPQGICAAI